MKGTAKKEVVLLAGLPRTGSTLLSNILAQNPLFHIEGNSGLCQIMWDACVSCEIHAREQLPASGRFEQIRHDVVSGLVSSYYNNCDNKIILDKCRPWVSKPNIEMARRYICPDVKSIIMLRPIDEVVASYARVHFQNGGDESVYEWLLSPNNHVLMNSYNAVMYALQNRDSSQLFLTYDDLTSNITSSLLKIYNFIGRGHFTHNTNKIKQVITENDEVNNMVGMHRIRPTVARLKHEVQLPLDIKSRCDSLTDALFHSFCSQGDAA